MNHRALLLVCTFLLSVVVAPAEIGIGDTREDVLRQLGKPTSIARRGDHEIFVYPKGARVEFVDAKVVDVKGPLPASIAAPPPQTAAPEPPKAAAPAPTAKTYNEPPPKTAPEPTGEYNPAVAANELAKHVEKMDTPWGAAPPKHEVHSPLESLPSFLTGLALRLCFTVIALKLAFKYWEMDAFWTGIFAIAGIDLTLHAVLELLGPATGGFTTMGAVENGIPGLVLIFTINRFCFNKRIQNAVVTAAAVKLVVTLCYIFAGVAMLNAVYG